MTTHAPPSESPQLLDPTRCEYCSWPFDQTVPPGCRPGNCSYRAHDGSDEQRRLRGRRVEVDTRVDGEVLDDALERAGVVSHAEAREIAERFHHSHWYPRGTVAPTLLVSRLVDEDSADRVRLVERARYSIPANPERDDDIRLDAYIARQERIEAAARALIACDDLPLSDFSSAYERLRRQLARAIAPAEPHPLERSQGEVAAPGALPDVLELPNHDERERAFRMMAPSIGLALSAARAVLEEALVAVAALRPAKRETAAPPVDQGLTDDEEAEIQRVIVHGGADEPTLSLLLARCYAAYHHQRKQSFAHTCAAEPETRPVLELRSPHVWDVDANDGRGPQPRGVVHRMELLGDELLVADVTIDETGKQLAVIAPTARVPFAQAVHLLQNTTPAEREVLATHRTGPPAEVPLEQLSERELASLLTRTEVDLDRAVLGGELAALQAMGRLLDSLRKDDRERLEGVQRARAYRAHAMGLAAAPGWPAAHELFRRLEAIKNRSVRVDEKARAVVSKASLYVDDPLRAEHAELARVLEEKA